MQQIIKKKILFLHSAGHQHGDEGSSRLLAYLRQQLSDQYQIIAPLMPDPDNPEYQAWHSVLEQLFKIINDGDILIGHSLGGSVLMKFLSEEGVKTRISSVHLIAVPFWGLGDWEVAEFMLSEDFANTLPAIESVHIYQSKDDPIVSVQHAYKYASELPRAEMHITNGQGHVFWDGLPELTKQLDTQSIASS